MMETSNDEYSFSIRKYGEAADDPLRYGLNPGEHPDGGEAFFVWKKSSPYACTIHRVFTPDQLARALEL